MTSKSAPVEKKVTAATLTAGGVGVILAILTWVQDNPGLLSGLPNWLEGLLYVILTPVMVYVAGYSAPHTPRASAPHDTRPPTGPAV